MPPRNRANIVCTACHSRKIKCDLQSSSDGVCKNCRRSHQSCSRRESLRKRKSRAIPSQRSSSDTHVGENLVTTAIVLNNSISRRSPQRGFVSHCSSAYYKEVADTSKSVEEISTGSSFYQGSAIGEITRADVPPRSALFKAWADAYMTQAFHHCPVVDEKDILNPDPYTVLHRSISLVGNAMRHDPSGPRLGQGFYEKIKLLIYADQERDVVQTLKTLCLISLWNSKPSNPISLDGCWHWTGVATRLAFEMGLHRESTYRDRPNASSLRRIFWQLHNADSFLTAYWGRPSLLRCRDFDVQLPTLQDFEVLTPQSHVFIQSTKLYRIFSSISELRTERRPIDLEEIGKIQSSLHDWVSHLPPELQLYDAKGDRTKYFRPASETMIQYFVALIISEFLKFRDKERPWRMTIPTLVAASCAAALYDEIDCRDEAIFLPAMTGFFCLAIALPLLHYVALSSAKEAARAKDLEVLRAILRKMQDRFGDAQPALRLMDKFEETVKESPRRPSLRDEHLEEAWSSTRHLFPFPPSICGNMDLLELEPVSMSGSYADFFIPAQDWPSSDGTFNMNLMDLLLHQNDGDIVLETISVASGAGEQILP